MNDDNGNESTNEIETTPDEAIGGGLEGSLGGMSEEEGGLFEHTEKEMSEMTEKVAGHLTGVQAKEQEEPLDQLGFKKHSFESVLCGMRYNERYRRPHWAIDHFICLKHDRVRLYDSDGVLNIWNCSAEDLVAKDWIPCS